MDYYNQLRWVEMQDCLAQHIMSLRMLEELMFAHKNGTTYELEFNGNPAKVIRNLNQIRGNAEPQEWYRGHELRLTSKHPNRTINAILRYFRKI